MSLIEPNEYQQFLRQIDIKNIHLKKIDFSVQEEKLAMPKSCSVNITRLQPTYRIEDKLLAVNAGYLIMGLSAETEYFTGKFHFQIIYGFKNIEMLNAVLEKEKTRSIFLVNQTDKLLWSYLRRLLHELLSDAGLPPLVLPLYR